MEEKGVVAVEGKGRGTKYVIKWLDDGFKKEYDAIQPEMDAIRAIVDASVSLNMTQKEFAECTGINQVDIAN